MLQLVYSCQLTSLCSNKTSIEVFDSSKSLSRRSTNPNGAENLDQCHQFVRTNAIMCQSIFTILISSEWSSLSHPFEGAENSS